MKNIQIIDGAENCVFDIFAVSEDEFRLIFPAGHDVAFVDEVCTRVEPGALDTAFQSIWARPVRKPEACGIHGTLFFGLDEKKIYYPTRRDEEAINPDGTPLRKLQA